MCTPNYIRRSDSSSITDLSFYSLKMNTNIPTTYATTRPFGLAPILGLVPATKPAKAALVHASKSHIAAKVPRYRSKLDLLVQTATLQPMPAVSPTSSISSLSQSSSSASLGNDASGAMAPASSASSISSSAPNSPESLSDSSSSEDGPVSRASAKYRYRNSVSGKKGPVAIKLASPSVSTKRQRSGPSCDCCRARKIKCDSEIVVLAQLPPEITTLASSNSHRDTHQPIIAHCDFICEDPRTGYQYFKILRGPDGVATKHKLGNLSYLKFKPCTACGNKRLHCQFSKGFTRNDIIKFNKSEKLQQVEPLEASAARRISKKTSCRMCRFKKIKCVKVDGSTSCLNCTRKLLDCSLADHENSSSDDDSC